jgi:cellobiose-specific phosphotransferase system component IIA
LKQEKMHAAEKVMTTRTATTMAKDIIVITNIF